MYVRSRRNGAAQQAGEAGKPPMRWPGASAPAAAYATASRQLQIASANALSGAATAAPRRSWLLRRLAAYLQGRWAVADNASRRGLFAWDIIAVGGDPI